MKKLFACLLAVITAVSLLAVPALAGPFQPGFEIQSQSAYIVNEETGVVMYEKNAHEPMPAASMTKLMTTLILLEQTSPEEMDTRDFIAYRSLYDALYGKGGSTADIASGAELTARELLYAMMLPSANEAAYIVAYKIGNGSVDNFVYIMNSRAKQLGCQNTTFVDPCGLDLNNVTTAYDMAQIVRYMSTEMPQKDLFAEVCKAYKYEMPAGVGYSTPNSPYSIFTTNMMIDESRGDHFYREYMQGGKTGSLEDWQNYAGWSVQDGMKFISVVMHTPLSADQYAVQYGYRKQHPALYETCLLMDWVYENFKMDNALDTGAFVTEIPVKYSTDTDTLKLYPADGLRTILPNESDQSILQKTYNLPESVAAPVKQGDVIGTVTLYLSGEAIGTVDLIAGSNVSRNPVLYFISKLGEFFSSLYFKVLMVLVVIALAVYAAVFLRMSYKHRNSRQVKRRD